MVPEGYHAPADCTRPRYTQVALSGHSGFLKIAHEAGMEKWLEKNWWEVGGEGIDVRFDQNTL